MNKLILAEKPSTARILAHVVGAREKIYSKNNKAYCFYGNNYYVVNARGHLYGLGEPEDYGYSKKYSIDELPMFPDFKIFPCGKDTEDLRTLISELINRDDIDELICATDAGREGELIFRQIYEANKCTKPVGICPKCGKNVFEGRNNFYCEESRNSCNFALWKEDRYNGISVTSQNASDLLAGKKIFRTKKKLNGGEERKAYVMEVTDKYVNIREAEDK